MAAIISVGTAVPEHRVNQAQARALTQQLFDLTSEQMEPMMKVFEHAQVNTRYSAAPLDWFTHPHTFSEKNTVYIQAARALCVQAIRACLEPIGLAPQAIDHLIVVSSTGIATPSLDALLINDLSLRSDTVRTPVWGLGCVGGIAGVARAAEFATARPASRVMVVAVELCTLTFLKNDRSRQNLIATSLFGDGAAAVLVAGDETGLCGPTVQAHTCITWPDTLALMGWDIVEDGFKVVLSKSIPAVVRNNIRMLVDTFLATRGLTPESVSHYITHPGGPKVIEAYKQALDLDETQVAHTRTVLESYGNMSSPTVLFILQKFLAELRGQQGTYGLASAMGPGFSAELLLLKW